MGNIVFCLQIPDSRIIVSIFGIVDEIFTFIVSWCDDGGNQSVDSLESAFFSYFSEFSNQFCKKWIL